MNKKKIRNPQIFSIIFIFILGTLLHFTYQISGENKIVAIFSAVNESTWEHLKLLFFPMLFTTIIGYFYLGKAVPNLLCANTLGIIISMIFMVSFFYTYTGILGRNITVIDIILFFVSTILGEFMSYILMVNNFKCNNNISVIILACIFICFAVFTYSPPHIGLFKDPTTLKYGL